MTTPRVFSKPRTPEQEQWRVGKPVKVHGMVTSWIVVGYRADGLVVLQRSLRDISDVVDPRGRRFSIVPERLQRRGVKRTPQLLRHRAAQMAKEPRRCEHCGQWVVKPRKGPRGSRGREGGASKA